MSRGRAMLRTFPQAVDVHPRVAMRGTPRSAWPWRSSCGLHRTRPAWL